MKHTTITKEKPVTEMVMKMERENFLPSKPSPVLLKQQRTRLSYQSGGHDSWSAPRVISGRTAFDRANSSLCHPHRTDGISGSSSSLGLLP